MEKTFPLGKEGPRFWTRERAREIRPKVERLLSELSAGDAIVIDAAGVEVFDFSFANEFFGKLVMIIGQEGSGRFLVIENLTEYARENLAKALESLNLAAIERRGKKLEILGKIHSVDRQTFEAIVERKAPITASELKDELGVNLNAMNERLAKLTSMGLIRRERGLSPAGREQYEYRILG